MAEHSDRTGDDAPAPAVTTIEGTARFAAVVERIAAATGRDLAAVRADARTSLEEMAANVSAQGTQVWDRFGTWLARAYTIDADTAPLPGLTALGRQHCLVFLPNHRSYLDPLVLRQVLHRAGLPPNHILGGVNLAVWPFSMLGKRAGLVFIRRTSRDDPVYPAMLRLYLGHLLSRRANLEWYFEGGRTRTGKLRPPKMGVLRYLLDAFAEQVEQEGPTGPPLDVYLVPVAIVYDQQAEVAAIAREEGGATKTPESLRWLVGFARAQSRRRGGVHVRFGEPLSLRTAIEDARARAGSADPETVVPRVAFEIAHRINDATPITAPALLTFALLGNDGRALTLAECARVLEPFLAYVGRRGLPVTSLGDLTGAEGLRPALTTLLREGVVQEYAAGLQPVYSIAPDRQHEAAFYRNTVTHWFVTRAICELAAVRTAELGRDEILRVTWEGALALRDLLKYEFFFPRKRDFADQVIAEAELALPRWRESSLDAQDLVAAIADTGMFIAHRVVGPYLEAYLVVAERLAAMTPAAAVDAEALVQQCLAVARQRWLQHDLHTPESISKDLMQNALKLAGNRDLLGTGGPELAAARAAFAAELADVVRRVGVVRETALTRLRTPLPTMSPLPTMNPLPTSGPQPEDVAR